MARTTPTESLMAFLLLLLLIVAGCGNSANQLVVHGTVTYDGELVLQGRIRFVPIEDTKGLPALGLSLMANIALTHVVAGRSANTAWRWWPENQPVRSSRDLTV